ncbi:hypothetical protein GCM10009638_03180 [Luteococcus sanguinis]
MLVDVLETHLRLATTLNLLSSGRITAPEAEARLRGPVAHHVADPDGLLGLDPLTGSPVRLALARAERLGPTVWVLLLPEPGRAAGLRGPAPVTTAAIDAGAVVVSHSPVLDGRALAWIGQGVGPAVQWRLWAADRVVLPDDPREATRMLQAELLASAEALTQLDAATGTRPEHLAAPTLGPAYDERAQHLLDRAWLLLEACEQGLADASEVLHSHAVLERERHLRSLAGAARFAVSSAVSWPTVALA